MNKWVGGILIALFLLLGAFALLLGQNLKNLALPTPLSSPGPSSPVISQTQETESQKLAIVAQDLEVPWSIVFLPDRSMLVTEREGRVRLISSQGQLQQEPVATLSEVKQIGEGGLLGITLHPEFEKNQFVYLYYTYEGSNNTRNRVERFVFVDGKLQNGKVIVDAIPGASNHDGGRIAFGPDEYLYVATGDSQEPSLAQDRNSLAGKILRMTEEGQPALGNPFNTLVYSFGHRNPQGLAWDDQGQLWATEHGRSGIQSGFDELNLIESGKNYGWPDIQGDESRSGMVKPVIHSGGSTTWAPAGAAFYNGSIFFTGLRGQGLYEAVLQDQQVRSLKKHFDGELGRIRDVVLGPDNFLYIATSNRDGRGLPKTNDDKILRVDPSKL